MSSANISVRNTANEDFEAIWNIFNQVVVTGDTYAYSPDTTKEEAHRYWLPPEKHTYVK